MNGLLTKLVSRRLRGIPAALCALAVAMQVMSPVLHAQHELAHQQAAVAGAPGLHAPADHGSADQRHDSATCPQCRLVSQLRTLSPLSVVATLPALRADWIADSTCAVASSQATRDSGAPRAPPLLA
jgi:hypothetical protein